VTPLPTVPSSYLPLLICMLCALRQLGVFVKCARLSVVDGDPKHLHNFVQIPIIKRLMKSRLKNNTFVYMKSGRSNTTEPSKAQDGQAQARAAKYDLSKLQEDSEATALSYRRLPPPIATESFTHGAAALPRDAHICLHALVPALLGVLAADTPLGDELRSRQHELAVIAPAQGEGEDDAPPLTLTWQRQEGPPVKLLELDRVAVRRVLLGLLALQSGAESARP